MSEDRAARQAAVRRGVLGERLVADLLTGAGWTVVARNWRGGGSEIDLVVARGADLRFVEVKSRSGSRAGFAVGEALGGRQQKRLVRAAEAFLLEYDAAYDTVAFTVALIDGQRITLLDDPFDA